MGIFSQFDICKIALTANGSMLSGVGGPWFQQDL